MIDKDRAIIQSVERLTEVADEAIEREDMRDMLTSVLNATDLAYAKDPNLDVDADSRHVDEALLYGQRRSAELERLFGSDVSDVQKIAVRDRIYGETDHAAPFCQRRGSVRPVVIWKLT